jgi:predicted SnoaL-like aldol condensation-catalyzing enzyme
MMPTPEESKEIARRLIDEVFAKRNLDALDEMLSEDYVEHQVAPGVSPDKAGARLTFEMLLRCSADMSCELVHLIASNDLVALHGVYRGTDTGGAMPGMRPTNRPFEISGIDIVRVDEDGKIAEHWGVSDAMGMMDQLGLFAPPPPS